jgi:hypothetical protein
VVPAKQTNRATVDLGPADGLSVTSVRTDIEWAIFVDGSSIGEDLAIQEVFARRARDEQALRLVLAALKTGAASGSGLDSLRLALQQLGAGQAAETGEFAVKNMRANLQMAVDGAIKVSPTDFLAYWIPEVEAAWRVADTHRRPKDSPRK